MSAERRTLRIAHSKYNCHDLRVMEKTGDSNFFLKDRRLSASFKKGGSASPAGGFDALAAQARPLSTSY